jgi:hypothetical protein
VRAGRRRLATALAVLAGTVAPVAVTACGSDDESTTQPRPPSTSTATTQTSTTTSTPAPTTTTTGAGGVEPGDDNGGQGETESGDDSGGSGGSGPSDDTPTHDVTPPANTPQGQFEQYCNQNPDACG